MRASYSLCDREIKEAIADYVRRKVGLTTEVKITVTISHDKDDRTRADTYGATASTGSFDE